MANIQIYDGLPVFTSGSSTPFGFYDNDVTFQSDAVKVANFCAQRLGFPIVSIELQDKNFFTAFEQAVTTYGNELYAYKIRQDYLSLEGSSTGSSINSAIITPNLGNLIKEAQQYGSEAGTGGNVTWKTGSINLTSSIQTYDLNAWAVDEGFTSSDLEIKRIFHSSPPAILKFYDPLVGSHGGGLRSQFGFGNSSPAMSFVLMPLNYDLQVLQQIELNDTIRKSNYSFEIQNNNLRIFPIPNGSVEKLYFHFILKSERAANSVVSSPSLITNVSNVPFNNPIYSQMNSVGRSWVFEYTLALCKEMLGYIRGKYGSIPIPGDNVQLNQSDLISSATADKTSLIESLRDFLNETSKDKLLERRGRESEILQKELNNVPFPIYIF